MCSREVDRFGNFNIDSMLGGVWMAKIAYIPEEDIEKYSGIRKVEKLKTRSDVATMVDTVMYAVEKCNVPLRNILYAVTDEEGFYYLVVGNSDADFNLMRFLNDLYVGSEVINCANVKLAFPVQKYSRGIYNPSDIANSNLNVGEKDNKDSTETGTSFLDEDDEDIKYTIRCTRLGSECMVEEGEKLLVGRSVNDNFPIPGNSNLSRSHCVVKVVDGDLYIKDNKSLNGTFINGKRLSPFEEVKVAKGTRIKLADEEIEIL